MRPRNLWALHKLAVCAQVSETPTQKPKVAKRWPEKLQGWAPGDRKARLQESPLLPLLQGELHFLGNKETPLRSVKCREENTKHQRDLPASLNPTCSTSGPERAGTPSPSPGDFLGN